MLRSWLVALALIAHPLLASETGTLGAAVTSSPAQIVRLLDNAVHDALRREAAAKGSQQQAAVRKLLALYQRLANDPNLPTSKRSELQALVGRRLTRASAQLKRRLTADAHAKPAKISTAERDALAQQLPGAAVGAPGRPRVPTGAGGGLTAATAQQAQQLVDLIESTVMPSSWQASGGTGAVKYFAPGMVLVISATDQVHEQVGGVLGDLRK